jgi:ferrous iron transport protein A
VLISMSAVCVLADLPVGNEAVIQRLLLAGPEALRLREMGLLPGTRLKLLRWAPLGDPLEISVRGYNLSLRKHEAEKIEVAAEPAAP